MGKFNRDRGARGNDRHGGGFGRRDHNRGFNRGGDRPAMYKVVCDACHKDCEVPFKPSNDKPIYCNECFAKQGGSRGNDRRGGGDRRPRFENRPLAQPNQNSKEILDSIKSLNYKLDELIKVLAPKTEKKEEKPDKKTGKKKTTVKKTNKTVAKKKK